MCTFDENGIYFEGGKHMKYSNIDLSSLTKSQLDDLQSTYANKLDVLYIRKNIHEIRNSMQSVVNKLDNNLNELKLHTTNCPINRSEIEHIAYKSIPKYMKEKVLTTGKIATAIVSILALLVLIAKLLLR